MHDGQNETTFEKVGSVKTMYVIVVVSIWNSK